MRIDKLNVKSVRTTDARSSVVTLSDVSLQTVVGGDGGIGSSICDIHFYYPADGTA